MTDASSRSDLSITPALAAVRSDLSTEDRPLLLHFGVEANVAMFMTNLAKMGGYTVISLNAGAIADAEARGYTEEDHPLWHISGEEAGSIGPTLLHISGFYELEADRRESVRKLLTYRTIQGLERALGPQVKMIITTTRPNLRLPFAYLIRLAAPRVVGVGENELEYIAQEFPGLWATYTSLGRALTASRAAGSQALMEELKDIVFGAGAQIPANGGQLAGAREGREVQPAPAAVRKGQKSKQPA